MNLRLEKTGVAALLISLHGRANLWAKLARTVAMNFTAWQVGVSTLETAMVTPFRCFAA